MNKPPAPEQPVADPLSAAQRRRREVLGTLGKGVAAAGGAVPLYSHATRNIVTPSGQQCTVSGFQSAAVSATAETKQTCGAFHPRYFFNVSQQYSISRTDNFGYSGDITNAEKYFDQDMAAPWDSGRAPGDVRVEGGRYFIRTSTTTFRELTATNWPAVSAMPATSLTVNAIFPGALASDRLVLAQLYDWSVGGTAGETPLAYFIAAYFNALMTTGPAGTVNVPFDSAYVQSQFANNYAQALLFFKDLCVASSGLIRPAP